jgi:hypothetical protein
MATMFAFIYNRLDYGINGDCEVLADAIDPKRKAWLGVADSISTKRNQFVSGTHNETLPVVAMRVNNPIVRPRDYWEIAACNLKERGWSLGCLSTIDS